MSIATLMGHIDSNVKHLQERAHVWDTFQLHVSAWNEQIKALDRKVDFISRGQERFEQFDTKMNELLGSHEAQLQRVSSRLDEMDTRLAAIAKSVEENTASSEPAAPLLGEFATRGVLSTLKGIEKKVDKLVAQAKAEEKLLEKNSAHKCQAPSVLEALLQDVASKVDVIFDRLPEEGEAEIRGGDLRVWRRMASPLRRTWRALESVERAVRSAEDTNVQLKKGHDHLLRVANHTLRYAAQGSECCRKLREETHNASVRSTNSCIAAVSAGTETSLRNMRDLFANASQEIEHLEDLILDNIAYNASCPNESPSLVVDAEEQDFSDSSNLLDYEDVSTQSSVPLTSQPSTGRGKRFQWLCSDVNGPSGVTSLLGDREEEEATAPVVSEWDGGGQRERLFCDQQTAGGGWTVVQRRGNFNGRLENFTRRWTDYKRGFGDLNAEFWAGNDFLHLVTSGDRPVKLRIELKDFEGNKTFAEYSLFRVGSEKTNYRLTLAGYSGNASDSFSSHNGTPFSTIDRTNDKAPECCPCAKTYSSGWWFHSCFEANLNGEYFLDPEGATDFQGIIWEKWRDDYSLAGTEMKIRPLDFHGS
ncbi:angiopoietin-related protein 7-like isoform X2 [Cloeon dipterum]